MDKYYVYRPLLDLIGHSEGTDKGDGYNETLGYGAYTGGDVDLVSMTRDQIDALQTKMLRNPKNKWKSSAVGRYQEVRTTRREIDKTLKRTGKELFDEAGQDEDGCYLLGVRGVDKWLSGRLKESSFINNLAMEWASFPTTSGKGHYDGQQGKITLADVKAALAKVKIRHEEGQPKVIVPVEQPIVPKEVDKAVTKQTNGWGWSGIGLGGLGAVFTAIAGWPWQTVALFAGVAVAGGLLALVIGPWIVRRVKIIRAEVGA